MESNKGEVLIYREKDGQTKLEVNLREETVWLTQKQMSMLFAKDVRTINEHIKNIFKEGELDKNSTIRNFRIVQKEGGRSIEREIEFYNLDAIISVGYRVKSLNGTRFRIWATKTLKDHLVKGYTINEKKLRQRDTKLQELKKIIRIFQGARQSKILNQNEANGLLQVITDYANSWVLLQKYDQEKIALKKKTAKEKSILDYAKAKNAITQLKNNLLRKKRSYGYFRTRTSPRTGSDFGQPQSIFRRQSALSEH